MVTETIVDQRPARYAGGQACVSALDREQYTVRGAALRLQDRSRPSCHGPEAVSGHNTRLWLRPGLTSPSSRTRSTNDLSGR